MIEKKARKKRKSSKEKFCIKCGKRGISGIMCRECKADLDKKIFIKDISIKRCVECGKIFSQNKWLSANIANVIEKELNKNKKSPVNQLEIIEIDLPKINPGEKKEIGIVVKSDENEFLIPIILEGTYCTRCSKKGSQYFEGILQLKNPSPEMLERLNNDIKKAGSKGVYITKKEEKKNVVHYYLTDKHYLLNIGKKLYHNYGGTLKVNEKLFSLNKQTSKDIFRINVFFEASNYSKGDVIYFRDSKSEKIIRISSLGSKVSGINLINNHRVSFDYKETENKNNEVEKLEVKEAIISTLYPHISVIHPETYQAIPVENSEFAKKDSLKTNETLNVVEKDNLLWMVI